MKINYHKSYVGLMYGYKLPRKVKKYFLGKRMSKSKLNRLIKSVKVVKSAETLYEDSIIEPYAFCPKCGCTGMSGSGNRVDYPEHWEDFYCHRCRYIVGTIDNSPFIHVLQTS